MKVLSKKQLLDSDLTANLIREVEIHQHLRHPNIVKFYGWFWDDRKIYLLMEYAPMGSLFSLLK